MFSIFKINKKLKYKISLNNRYSQMDRVFQECVFKFNH